MSLFRGTPLEDFRNFLYLAWKHLNLPDPTPVQYDIAHYLQYDEADRKGIEAFRGVGKSWISSVYVIHQLELDPSKNVLVVSASKDRADQFVSFSSRLIHDMPELQHLRPRKGQRNSQLAFDVGPAGLAHMPSLVARGITGQLTGNRADIIVADDVEVPNNSATQAMRDKLSEAVKEFAAIIKPRVQGQIIFLGTPQCEQSIYNLLPDRGYKMRIWPAEYPDAEFMNRVGHQIAPKIREELERDDELVGRPTDPQRFDEDELEKRRLDYGNSGYRLQFMLDTSLSDADRYPLKLRDLIVADLDVHHAPGEKPVWSNDKRDAETEVPTVGMPGDRFYNASEFLGQAGEPYTGSVMVIDPSGRGADETSYAVVKMLGGYLYLTAAGGFGGGYSDDVLQQLCTIAKTQKVNHIVIESNFGDGMFTKLLAPWLRRVYPCTVEEVRNNIMKENRIIDTLEPVMNQHRLVVDRTLIRKDFDSTKDRPTDQQLQYQLFWQMTRMQRLKGALAHDDRLDAVAMAVGYWVEQMGQDADERISERDDERFMEEIERFMDNAYGRKAPVSPTWMDSMLNG